MSIVEKEAIVDTRIPRSATLVNSMYIVQFTGYYTCFNKNCNSDDSLVISLMMIMNNDGSSPAFLQSLGIYQMEAELKKKITSMARSMRDRHMLYICAN